MRRLLLCVLFGASACGGGNVSDVDAIVADTTNDSGPDPNDGAHSGSRLKLTWFVFADGTRQFDGLYDAQRKESCFIYDWADGSAYCTPDYSGSIVYTNAGCTQKVAQVYKDPSCAQPPPSYLLEYGTGTCTYQPAHLYARGSATSVAQYWYRYSDGTCGGPFTGSYYDFYTLGGEIPTTELVKVTASSPTGVGRLGQRFYQSSDGMRRPGPVHDAMLGADCYPSTSSDPTIATCVPSTSYAGYLHDAACTQPELGVASSCPKPAYSAYYDNNACPGQSAHYYSTGSAVAGTPLYYKNGNTCVATTAAPNTTYYQVGPELALTTLGLETDNVASHRLQVMHYKTAEGVRVRRYPLFDTANGTQCYPSTLPDKSIRCLPAGSYTSTYYTSSTCTQPIDVIEVSTGPASCAIPTPPKYASKYIPPAAGTCSYSYELHTVTTPYTGPLYTNYGTCQPYTPTNVRVYNIGAALPLTDFMSATSLTDP
jgi:hypothetical protein